MMPWRAAAVTGGYLVAWLALDFFGYVFRVAPGASLWNPADGLSLALVAVFGPRMIPLLLVGPLMNGWLFWLPDAPLAVLAQAVCSTACYGAAGWMLYARNFDARLERLGDATAFVVIALFASSITATFEAFSLISTGVTTPAALSQTVLQLWAGDTIGIFGLGPFFLRAMLWVKGALYDEEMPDEEAAPRVRPRPGLILAQALATVAVVGASPFRWGVFADSPTQLVLAVVVWVALTHGAAGAAVVVVAVNLGLLIVRQFTQIPLAIQDQQLLLVTVGIVGILIGAAVSARARATALLTESRAEIARRRAAAEARREVETNLARAQEVAGMGSYRWDIVSNEVWWSDQFYRLLGMTPNEIVPSAETFLEFVHPDDRPDAEHRTAEIRAGRQPAGTLNDVRIIRRDGAVRHFRLAREVEYASDGRLARLVGVVRDITEEHDTGRALRESRERLAVVAANMPGVVFQHRLTGSGAIACTFIGEGVRRLFGVAPEEITARPDALLAFIHPDDRKIVQLTVKEAAKSGSPWQQEFRVQAQSGTIWVRGATQPRADGDGAYLWDGVLVDIQAEKLIQNELRKSEERFRLIASQAPMAIAIVGANDGKLHFSNRACEQMFGYAVGDMHGLLARGLCADPADFARLRYPLRKSGVVANREIHLRRRDGTQFWGMFSFMAMSEEGSGAGEVLVCGFDSTELRETRAESSRHAFDLGIRIKELRCLYLISKLTNDTIRPIAEICRDLVDVLPQGLRSPDQTAVRLVLRGDEYISANYRAGRGHLQSPILAEGETIGEITISILGDAAPDYPTPFLQEEREMIETVALHLGRMVVERDTAARLVQAQKLESLGRLTGGIAHDFNNLLTVIFGNLELAEAQCANNVTLQKCVANAMQASRRAADLTTRLQAFSRRQPLLPTTLRINDLISSTLDLLRRSIGEGIEIVTELDSSPLTVHVDPAQMEAALLNIAVNARDAMPTGGRLSIATRPITLANRADNALPPGPYVELVISDTGVGMAPDVAKRVFEPFFTTKDVGQGSGLGLSMVFGFIKQSGGHIEVASEVGKGTTFGIYLPLMAAEESVGRETPGNDSPALTGECILVVEDEPQVLDYVARLLRTSGYRILTASAGPEALRLLENNSGIDLLLTDVGLPDGMSGVELVRKARELDPEMKVVLASGYAYEHLVETGAIAADLPIVFKPFVRRELLDRIRSVLDGDLADEPDMNQVA
jgi:PAS domain S-box-containing protein